MNYQYFCPCCGKKFHWFPIFDGGKCWDCQSLVKPMECLEIPELGKVKMGENIYLETLPPKNFDKTCTIEKVGKYWIITGVD